MIGIDTNLLIYAHRSAVPEHESARRALETASGNSRGWGISVASISEFWGIVTHPAAAGGASKPEQARDFLRSLTETGGMRIWSAGGGFTERLLQLACDLNVSGARIFDLQIALTVFDNGASEIWTHDVNFVRVPGLRIHDPVGN
jgi:predicted nucleic acid-binding protein